MEYKICFKCNKNKPLTDYYKHPKMGDGHLNKCKECTKDDVNKRYKEKVKDEHWLEYERERGRTKYYRLGYRKSLKPIGAFTKNGQLYKEKYPEKYKAVIASQRISSKGGHNHHWSYNEEHWKDVINLSKKDHIKAHRFIIYDQERMMYRTIDGILLDTKERHLAYIMDKIKNQDD
jgi:hypothetical protein